MRTVTRLLPVLTMTGLLLAPVTAPVAAQVVPGASDAGVVPFVAESGQGGNVACTELEALDGIAAADLRTSDRLNWGGGGFDAPLPEGIAVTVTGGIEVTWTSTGFPMAAVIVKGGDAANVYVYTDLSSDVFADGGLVAPENASGGPAGLSNLTLCWDAGWTPPPPEDPNLVQLCLQAAEEAEIFGITWVTDPIEIRDGVVDPMTVPDDVTIAFDEAMGGTVTFVAPDPVAMVVTASSAPATHLIAPPAKEGSVPLSSNPGDGDVVLCGIASPPPVEELSCDVVPDTFVVGPVPILAGVVDESDLPAGITSVEPNATTIGFVSTEPVAAVIVVASPPRLTEFDPEVFEGSVDAEVDGQETIDVYFCIRSTSVDDPTDPTDPNLFTTREEGTDEGVIGTLDDPTTIPTGGGHSGRTALALVAFVILALTASTSLLVWSRTG